MSVEKLQQDFGDETEYLTLNTRKLFEMTLGATLMMNPTSDVFKEFQAEEVKVILEIDHQQ